MKDMLTDERWHSRYAECIDSCLHKLWVQMAGKFVLEYIFYIPFVSELKAIKGKL